MSERLAELYPATWPYLATADSVLPTSDPESSRNTQRSDTVLVRVPLWHTGSKLREFQATSSGGDISVFAFYLDQELAAPLVGVTRCRYNNEALGDRQRIWAKRGRPVALFTPVKSFSIWSPEKLVNSEYFPDPVKAAFAGAAAFGADFSVACVKFYPWEEGLGGRFSRYDALRVAPMAFFDFKGFATEHAEETLVSGFSYRRLDGTDVSRIHFLTGKASQFRSRQFPQKNLRMAEFVPPGNAEDYETNKMNCCALF